MLVQSIVTGVSIVVVLTYACYGAHFDRTEINASIIRAMCVLLPCLCASFVCGVVTLYLRDKSLRAELALAKALPDAAQAKDAPVTESTSNVSAVRIALIALGILLLALGLCYGGAADVLTKAINICTECIGLG